MTKDQYIKHIETVMKSPRSDSQKINCLVAGFEQYVNDVVRELDKQSRGYTKINVWQAIKIVRGGRND